MEGRCELGGWAWGNCCSGEDYDVFLILEKESYVNIQDARNKQDSNYHVDLGGTLPLLKVFSKDFGAAGIRSVGKLLPCCLFGLQKHDRAYARA